jgi:cytochrome c2
MRQRMVLFVILLTAMSVVVACGGQSADPAAQELVPATVSTSGNSVNGEAIFQERCTICHNATTEQLVGPGLAGVMTKGGPVHPSGVSYAGKLPNGDERSEETIAHWITVGGMGQIGTMSPQEMSDAEMADLLAYLRTLAP